MSQISASPVWEKGAIAWPDRMSQISASPVWEKGAIAWPDRMSQISASPVWEKGAIAWHQWDAVFTKDSNTAVTDFVKKKVHVIDKQGRGMAVSSVEFKTLRGITLHPQQNALVM